MTRRDLLRSTALAFAGPLALAQLPYPGTRYRDYSRCLPDYLSRLAAEAYERRNRAFAALTSAEKVRERQRWVRDTFWKLTGGMPERTPLNAKTVGSLDRPGYRLEKVLYESRPKLYIPANLYIPTTGRTPYPGVLFQMGHSLNGKANGGYQKCCQGLARLGYVVLAFDPMGQGERTYYPRPDGTLTRLSSADTEHTLPGRQMLLLGDTSTRFQVWDAVRSLDYLAEHPMVDRTRLASTGQSGGGTLTMLLACVDDRLACAAVASGNTENVACADFNPPGSTDDAEQNFLNSGPVGFDRWDLLYPLVPKPLLVMASARDFFGTYSPRYLSDGWEQFQKLQQTYELLGANSKLEWADTPLPHNLSYSLRLAIYNWFGRWLKNADPITEEPPVTPEPDETIWVSPKGNVVRSYGGETPHSLLQKQTPAKDDRWREAIGVELPRPDLKPAVLGRVPYRAVDVAAIEVATALGVWAPAWLYEPRSGDRSRPAVLVLEASGRSGSRWMEDGPWAKMAAEGYVVCAADVRGIGDLEPEYPRSHPRHARSHQTEEDFAWSSLILGSPLLGQRVTDVLALAQALRNHTGRRLVIQATGKMTVPALFAAALDRDIDLLELTGGLISYRSIIETEEYHYPLANFAFGLLRHTDLPELAASIAPRKIRLSGTVDAAGKVVSPTLVRRTYASPNVELG